MTKHHPSQPIIRPALLDDIPALCDLLADLFSLETDFSVDREKQAKGLRLLLQQPAGPSAVFVAELNGKVLGMCSVQSVISTAEGGIAGIVEDLVVQKDLRGQGIGSSLLGSAMDLCAQQGMTRMQLLADKDNTPALQFYSSLGWTGTRLICLRKQF